MTYKQPDETTQGWGHVTEGGAEMWDTPVTFAGDTVTLKDRLKLVFYPKKYFLYRYIEKAFKREMKDRRIDEPFQILDVGCGTGASVIDMKRMFGRRADVVGLDVVRLQVDIGNERLKKHGVVGELVWYEGSQMPFSDNSFDAIYTSDVFGHVPDVELFLAEMARVLKPGGVLAMYAESKLGKHAFVRKYTKERGLDMDPHAEFHISLYPKEEIRQFVEEAGFAIDDLRSSFLFAFFAHPDEFHPILQSQKKFFFLRMTNKLLTKLRKLTHPLYAAAAELHGFLEMKLFGKWFDAQGIVVLARKKKKS